MLLRLVALWLISKTPVQKTLLTSVSVVISDVTDTCSCIKLIVN
jgi:hypothetical protein